MAQTVHKLTALDVKHATAPGYLGDGGGLWLQVSKSGTQSWVFRYRLYGRRREMGLGAVYTVTLADARQKAKHCRQLLLDGIDPIEQRKQQRLERELELARSMSFDACAQACIEAKAPGWKNEKHEKQWRATLATYASPVFGKLPVQEVDTTLVLKAVRPLWKTKPETASRLRGRIENVLSWATVSGYRSGDNPAKWKGHLDQILADKEKVRAVKHHPALPHEEVGAFMAALRKQPGTAALALQFTILTATRTSEVLNAVWDEIDLTAKKWTIPADRMKTGLAHEVPLSPAALRLLKAQQKVRQSDFIFPGHHVNKPMSNMAMLMLLKRMNRSDLTVHGFRASFRTWAAEETDYPNEVCEASLAHAIPSAVEKAYRRTSMFTKRRQLMSAWAQYCGGK